MTTKDLIEQVGELNEKRTPGKWVQSHRPRSDGMYVTEVYDEKGQAIATCSWWYDKDKYSESGRAKTLRAENAQFIALAPQMAEALLEKDRQLQIAREALEEVWPRYLELFTLTGLGEAKDSVIYEQIEQVLSEMESE